MCVCLLVKTTLRCVGTWNVEGHVVVSLSRQVDAGLLGMLSDLVQNTAHSSTLSATIFSPFHFLWKFRGKPRLTRQGNRSECWIELGLHLQLDGDLLRMRVGEEGGRCDSPSLWSALAIRSLFRSFSPLTGSSQGRKVAFSRGQQHSCDSV
jgi:hypothetical protein